MVVTRLRLSARVRPHRPSRAVEATLRAWDRYDAGIGAHGFLPTVRDYRLVVERIGDAPFGVFHDDFLGCTEARYEATLPPWAVSMDDRLLALETTEPVVGGPGPFV